MGALHFTLGGGKEHLTIAAWMKESRLPNLRRLWPSRCLDWEPVDHLQESGPATPKKSGKAPGAGTPETLKTATSLN